MGLLLFIVLVVVLELVIEGLEDEDRFAEDEDDYDIAAFTNNSIFSASRTLNSRRSTRKRTRQALPDRRKSLTTAAAVSVFPVPRRHLEEETIPAFLDSPPES